MRLAVESEVDAVGGEVLCIQCELHNNACLWAIKRLIQTRRNANCLAILLNVGWDGTELAEVTKSCGIPASQKAYTLKSDPRASTGWPNERV